MTDQVERAKWGAQAHAHEAGRLPTPFPRSSSDTMNQRECTPSLRVWAASMVIDPSMRLPTDAVQKSSLRSSYRLRSAANSVAEYSSFIPLVLMTNPQFS